MRCRTRWLYQAQREKAEALLREWSTQMKKLPLRDWFRARLEEMGSHNRDALVEEAMSISREIARAITGMTSHAIILAFAAAVAASIALVPNKTDQETVLRSFIICVQNELDLDVLRRKSDDVFLRMFDQSMNRTYRVYRYVIIV